MNRGAFIYFTLQKVKAAVREEALPEISERVRGKNDNKCGRKDEGCYRLPHSLRSTAKLRLLLQEEDGETGGQLHGSWGPPLRGGSGFDTGRADASRWRGRISERAAPDPPDSGNAGNVSVRQRNNSLQGGIFKDPFLTRAVRQVTELGFKGGFIWKKKKKY